MVRASLVLLVFDLKRVLGWFPAVGKMCVIYDGERATAAGQGHLAVWRFVMCSLHTLKFCQKEPEEIHTSELVRDLA